MIKRKSKKSVDILTSMMDVVEHYDGFVEHDNEAPTIDWQKVAHGLMRDYIPAMQLTETLGRPPVDRSQLVKDVDALRKSGEAKSIQKACDLLQRQEKYLDLDDLASAYKRERRKLKN